MTSELSYWHKS